MKEKEREKRESEMEREIKRDRNKERNKDVILFQSGYFFSIAFKLTIIVFVTHQTHAHIRIHTYIQAY